MIMKMTMPMKLVWRVVIVAGILPSCLSPQRHHSEKGQSCAPEMPLTHNTMHKLCMEYVPRALQCQGVEGFQNVPPQHMPLWHTDCFELKAMENLQMQEQLQKQGTRFPFMKEIYIYYQGNFNLQGSLCLLLLSVEKVNLQHNPCHHTFPGYSPEPASPMQKSPLAYDGL